MAPKSNKTAKSALFGPPKIADPFRIKWPEISDENELKIIYKLERIFDEYKSCLETVKKPPKWMKKVTSSEPVVEMSQENKQRRDLFKSWFVTGINSVMKNLEKDKLRLVLICKTMQPSVMKKAILHLVNQNNCPALCVPDLLLHLQKSWPGLSSAAAFGVLKTNQSNDFDELLKVVDTAFFDAGLDRNKMFIDTSGASGQDIIDGNSLGEDEEIGDVEEAALKSGSISRVASAPTPVDGDKYYIYKDESKDTQKFSGETFIAFGADEDLDTDIVYRTVNGKRENSEEVIRSYVHFGIRPSLKMTCENPEKISKKRGSDTPYKVNFKKARVSQNNKLIENRQYRKINIQKRMKNSDKKQRKRNKKKAGRNK